MLSSTMKPAFNTPVSKFDPDGDPAENGKKLVQFEAAIRSSYRSSFAVCLDEKKFEALDQDTRSIYGQLLYDFLVVTTVGEALQIVLSAGEPDDGPASWRALQSHYGSSTDIHGAMILLGQLTAFQWEDNDNPALYATKLTKLERSPHGSKQPSRRALYTPRLHQRTQVRPYDLPEVLREDLHRRRDTTLQDQIRTVRVLAATSDDDDDDRRLCCCPRRERPRCFCDDLLCPRERH
jgi:hypothetical protein